MAVTNNEGLLLTEVPFITVCFMATQFNWVSLTALKQAHLSTIGQDGDLKQSAHHP